MRPMSPRALRSALSIRDLTDPGDGPHALQRLVDDATRALAEAWSAELHVVRGAPIVAIADNYDRLRYDAGAITRDARYTRYVCEGAMLRSHTSAMVPGALRAIGAVHDALIACPGMTYRRDCIDRLHTGEPHQLDLWRVSARALVRTDLEAMIELVVSTLLPGRAWRTTDAVHPYTLGGLQIDVDDHGAWIEIGECGLAHPEVLAGAGLAGAYGLAMGIGLDRVLMVRKGMPDIRLLRADDPRIASQMLDLSPYRAVSTMPPVARDLSIAVEVGTTDEELGDAIRAALGGRAELIESIATVDRTPASALPASAKARIGIADAQENVLLRVVLRALDRTLTHAECNVLRDAIYAAVHRGTTHQWAHAG